MAHRASIPASDSVRRPPLNPQRCPSGDSSARSNWPTAGESPPKTLTRWRGMGRGPVFNKFSKKVAYPLDGENGVLDYEKRHVYASTSERVSV